MSLSAKEQEILAEVIEWENTGRTGDGYLQARVLLAVLLRYSEVLISADQKISELKAMVHKANAARN